MCVAIPLPPDTAQRRKGKGETPMLTTYTRWLTSDPWDTVNPERRAASPAA
ncbi:uncharacterized protein SOCE836_059030 [Sorangium cellulosum]|uniref:Uncharacterized protein n=1 Tax=Sorangium cellulosum TaxID=56 RepID=A0A4P2QTS8_SORCE|nr:uncharacterized protein SOCE836_059030 [Sorangium cellulosum]WCQ93050.1 hypothetical protein NQZ70_05798 [Sorangium sp. Soce836]